MLQMLPEEGGGEGGERGLAEVGEVGESIPISWESIREGPEKAEHIFKK